MPTISNVLYRLFRTLSRKTRKFYFLFRLSRFVTPRASRGSMNFLANAIIEYPTKGIKLSVILHQHCLRKRYDDHHRLKDPAKPLYTPDLGTYYRTFDELNPLEQELIEMAYGNILDLGSCTGYYMPYLAEKGTAVGIDISDKIVHFAHERGIDNCFVGDLFTHQFNTTYDTITLVGNDIALTGTLYNLKKLLKKLYRLLNHKGQVLAIIRHIRTLKYWHVVYIPNYEGVIGLPLKCLFVNTNYFMRLSRKYGFTPKVINSFNDKKSLFYLVRLRKNQNIS